MTAQSPPLDNAITASEEDLLGRAPVAHDFAQSIRELDASHGIVIGVLGAWGHGKSSFINLMVEQFIQSPPLTVVTFNPWLFSGTPQLTDVFFRELAAELRLEDKSRFGDIAEGLDKYGDILSPLAAIPWFGGWFDRTFKALKTSAFYLRDRKKGARTLREKATAALSALDQPIVVVVDDIDRLTSSEIRDMFKLVRLTASFPNIIYLLAFDRLRVEHALTDDGMEGRAYLEKILQLSFDLPAIPKEVLRRQIFERLNVIVDGIEDARFTGTLWADVFVEVIEPLITNLRDVTRLALSARPAVRALGQEIETVDLLALEALRVFRPEVFQQLYAARLALTEPHDISNRTDTTARKVAVDRLLEAAGEESELVRDLIRRVFPAAMFYTENTSYGSASVNDWKREHRVAYIGYLDMYFSRTVPNDLLVFQLAERAYTLMDNEDDFGSFLDGLPPERREDVITALEAYSDEFPEAAVVPGSVTLLNRVSDIPERRGRGIFDLMTRDIVVTRVVLRLLRRLEEESARESAVRQILEGTRSHSSKELLLRSVGHVEGSGSRLVSAQISDELERGWVTSLMAGPPPTEDSEWNLLRAYWTAADLLGGDYVPPRFDDPAAVRLLLASARSAGRSQSWSSRTVHEEDHLAWSGLIRVMGGEEALHDAVARLRAAEGETTLVALAEKYITGWRPKEF
jgi:hypothetical protein